MSHAKTAAGLLFGLILGACFALQAGLDSGSWQRGLWVGVVTAPLAGLLFGLGLHAFLRSARVVRRTALPADELFDGERVLRSAPANLVVQPREYGLGPFAFGDLFWLAGMQQREAIGGALNLTSHRLVFRSHGCNRLDGSVSVLLPTLREAHDASRGWLRRLQLRTRLATLDFVIAEPAGWVGAIRAAQAGLDPAAPAQLQAWLARPDAGLGGLQPQRAIVLANDLLRGGRVALDAAEFAGKPLHALAALLLGEAFDRGFAAAWQARVDAGLASTPRSDAA